MGFKLDQFSQKLQKEIRGILNAQDSASLSRSSSQFQKRESSNSGKPAKIDNETGAEKDNVGYGCKLRYSIEIKFYIHDHYRRDIPGMNETVLDCLVNAFKEVGFGPQDDNRFVMPKHSQEAFDCEKGQDRAVITITEME